MASNGMKKPDEPGAECAGLRIFARAPHAEGDPHCGRREGAGQVCRVPMPVPGE